MIKAIETIYNGYRFRSRLEARWAVFFDTLGIKYEYEKEGYDLGEAGWYLPDFYIPTWKAFVEIKPGYPSNQEIEKCCQLSNKTEEACIVIWGSPWASLHHKDGLDEYYDYQYRAALADSSFGLGDHHIFTQCRRCPSINWLAVGDGSNCCIAEESKEFEILLDSDVCGFGSLDSCCDTDKWPVMDLDCLPRLVAAYTAARQARFEHGEKP